MRYLSVVEDINSRRARKKPDDDGEAEPQAGKEERSAVHEAESRRVAYLAKLTAKGELD